MRNNEESRKTENIGQTMKNYDARRKTHEKKSDNGRVQKERKTFYSSKKRPQKNLNFFQGKKKSRDGDEEKKG